MLFRFMTAIAAVIIIAALTACGGGGGSAGSNTNTVTSSSSESDDVAVEQFVCEQTEKGQRFTARVNFFAAEDCWDSYDIDPKVDDAFARTQCLFRTMLDIELELGVVALDESEAHRQSTASSQLDWFNYWSNVEQSYSDAINIRLGDVVGGAGYTYIDDICRDSGALVEINGAYTHVVLAHEIGHLFGLTDHDDPLNLMTGENTAFSETAFEFDQSQVDQIDNATYECFGESGV